MQNFYEKYYGQLVGFTVTAVSFEEDEFGGDPFPVLHIQHHNGDKLKFILSSDEEGNSAGFAFIEDSAA